MLCRGIAVLFLGPRHWIGVRGPSHTSATSTREKEPVAILQEAYREFIHALLAGFCLTNTNAKMMCESHINTSLHCAVNGSFSTTATRINRSVHEFQNTYFMHV